MASLPQEPLPATDFWVYGHGLDDDRFGRAKIRWPHASGVDYELLENDGWLDHPDFKRVRPGTDIGVICRRSYDTISGPPILPIITISVPFQAQKTLDSQACPIGLRSRRKFSQSNGRVAVRRLTRKISGHRDGRNVLDSLGALTIDLNGKLERAVVSISVEANRDV